jgi:hypothetical protein
MHKLTFRIEPEIYHWIEKKKGDDESLSNALRGILKTTMEEEERKDTTHSLRRLQEKTMAASLYAARLLEGYLNTEEGGGETFIEEIKESVNSEMMEYIKKTSLEKSG